MARKAENYASLPDYIMGFKCSRHRVDDMKQILRHYNQLFMSNVTKPELLGLVSALEKTLSAPELVFVISWLDIRGLKENFSKAKAKETRPFQKLRGRPESREEEGQVENEDDEEIVASTQPTECSVCMESLLSSQFPQERLTSSCDHEMTVCSTCVTQSIDQQIIDQPYEHISCPECSNRLQFEAIKHFLLLKSLLRKFWL
jgi:DNA-directed RNA polymerase subunit RPC12/RpoP